MAQSGWRMAFYVVGAPGLLLALIYPFVVRDYKTVALTSEAPGKSAPQRFRIGRIAREVFAARSGNFAYLASGLQMAMPAMLIAWLFDDRGRRLLLAEAMHAFAAYLRAKAALYNPDTTGRVETIVLSDGTYDFQFQLYNAASGGALVGSPNTKVLENKVIKAGVRLLLLILPE